MAEMKFYTDAQDQLYNDIINSFYTVQGQELIFCRVDENKVNATTQGIFYESIASSDILYNVKSYFPVEKILIDSAEKKIKEEKHE